MVGLITIGADISKMPKGVIDLTKDIMVRPRIPSLWLVRALKMLATEVGPATSDIKTTELHKAKPVGTF